MRKRENIHATEVTVRKKEKDERDEKKKKEERRENEGREINAYKRRRRSQCRKEDSN